VPGRHIRIAQLQPSTVERRSMPWITKDALEVHFTQIDQKRS